MPTVKAAYEAVLLFSLSKGEEAATALKEKFQELIAQHAEPGDIDDWGKRKRAYPINDETEALYVLYNFTATPEFPAELERVAGITDGVLRAMTVRK